MIALLWLFGSALAAGAAILLWAWRRGAMGAGLWAGAALAGQACTLAAIDAGPLVGYQHLRSELAGPLAVALGIAAAAAIAVALRHRELAATWCAHPAGWAALAALALGSVFAALPSQNLRKYAFELALAGTLQVGALACVTLALRALPETAARALVARLDALLGPPLPGPARLDAFAWCAALFVAVVAVVLALFSYQAHPHVTDEIAYVIHARYFAQGLPWMAPPSVPEAFETFLIETDGRRSYSVFPPGWPAILAIGMRLGVPWLVNPILGGVAVLLTYLAVQELYDRRLARASVALLALSPWHVFLSMSLMSHISSLVLTLATGLGVLWARSRRSWPLALGAGLALGVLGMSRPLEGVAVGLLVGLPLLVAALRERRASVLLAFAAGTLVTGVMGLAYNQVMTGSPLVFPAERYFDNVFGVGRYGLGFGPHKGVGWTGVDPFPGHGVRDIVVNAVLNIGMINLDLFGWWTGSVALVALGTLRARTLSDAFMVSALVLVPGLHSFYWFSGGPDFGARYWFLTILPCVVLAARGVAHLSAQDGAPRASRVELGVVLLAILAFSTFVPWRAADKYLHYRGMRPDVRVLREDPRLRGALVLVQGERHPDWASAVVYNPVEDAPEEPLFAWDRDANARRAVLAAYPERPVWIVKGPSRTHAGYEIASGPFVAAERERLAQGD